MAAARHNPLQSPPVCPVCAEDVPRGALACPSCGADHNSGWREDAETYDGIDLPADFDYEEFTRREFGSIRSSSGVRAIWWLTALILIVVTIFYFIATR